LLERVNVSHNPGNSTDPHAVVDSRGTVHLVWTDQEEGQNEKTLYAYKPQGGQWSEPIDIGDTAIDARFPSIAVGSDDKLHVVWQGYIPGLRWRIQYLEKAAGGTWTRPETMAAGDMCVRPRAAVDAAGNTHVVWFYGGWYVGIRYAERMSAGAWTPPVTVAPYPQLIFDPPDLLVDDQGNEHLVWMLGDTTYLHQDLYYSCKPVGGTWSQPENISLTTKAHSPLALVKDGSGDVVAIWGDDSAHVDADHHGGFCRTRDAAGHWGEMRLVKPDAKVYCAPIRPRLAANGDIYMPTYTYKDDGSPRFGWLAYLVRPSGSFEWSILNCDSVPTEPYEMPHEELAVGPDGTLYLFGASTPDLQHLDYDDIYCIEYKP
jgi:hypothetical protein